MLVLDDDSEVGKFVLSRNLGRQYDFLHTSYEVWDRGSDLRIDHKFICDLNFYAVQYLSHHPGAYRKCDVVINNSKHSPPRWQDVDDHMIDFLRQLSRRSGQNQPLEAASYALWRLNWIHPFIQGNGRTARALCYYVLCKEWKLWFPGTPIIPERIRKSRVKYEAGLEYADEVYRQTKRVDLSKIVEYLGGLLTSQLS